MNRVYALADSLGSSTSAAGDTAPVSPGAAAAANDSPLRTARWLAGLKAGRTMVTNGPLVGMTVNGQPPGALIAVSAAGVDVRYAGFLRSEVPVDHLEIILNGNVVRTIRLTGKRTSADFNGTLKVKGNGWLLLRAWNDAASPDILDLYPYATTNAFFLRDANAGTHCGKDADYFLAWLDRLEQAASTHEGYNTKKEREITLGEIQAARTVMRERR
jgi:hypothetical protein